MFTKTDIERYFVGEKQESFWFLVIGITAVVLALLFFFFLKTNFHKGVAIPLFVVGIILGAAGYTVYKRSDADRINNVYAYDMNPMQLKEKELPRMKTVMKNFIILRYVEILLFIVGLVLYIYFIRDIRNDFWRGLGLSLAIMALIGLIGDYIAENRGKTYINGIQSFITKQRL